MTSNPSLKPALILVIEDEGDILEVLKLLLEYEGHLVVTASNGQAALAAASARSFDLVVMDISMPEMSGLDVARALRADAKTADIRIVFHTGLDEHWVRERFTDYDLYLAKANDAEVLVAGIAALLARTRETRSVAAAAPAEPGFSRDALQRAQHALRAAMGLGSETLSLRELLAALAPEIEQLRKVGRSDADIAALLATATGQEITASALAPHGREAPAAGKR